MLKFSIYTEILENEGLKKKAEKSGVSYGTLKKVYNRGMAAWKTGHRPGTTPQQWGMARVNSYITKGKGTYHGADKDLRDDVQKEAMTDAEKKAHAAAVAAFKAKGGKVKKLPTGYAQGWHGKSDPGTGMKGMMDKGDTKQFGTKKKVGSMK